jgi:hypothetical protein
MLRKGRVLSRCALPVCRRASIAILTIAAILVVFHVLFCGVLYTLGRNIYSIWNTNSPEVVVVFYNG